MATYMQDDDLGKWNEEMIHDAHVQKTPVSTCRSFGEAYGDSFEESAETGRVRRRHGGIEGVGAPLLAPRYKHVDPELEPHRIAAGDLLRGAA